MLHFKREVRRVAEFLKLKRKLRFFSLLGAAATLVQVREYALAILIFSLAGVSIVVDSARALAPTDSAADPIVSPAPQKSPSKPYYLLFACAALVFIAISLTWTWTKRQQDNADWSIFVTRFKLRKLLIVPPQAPAPPPALLTSHSSPSHPVARLVELTVLFNRGECEIESVYERNANLPVERTPNFAKMRLPAGHHTLLFQTKNGSSKREDILIEQNKILNFTCDQ